MGYLYLCISLLSGAIKGFCGKKTSSYTNTFYLSAFANVIRMSLCIVIGLSLVFIEGDLNVFIFDARVILISAISGISTAFFVIAWLISIRKSAYMLMDVFLMLGALIPLTMGSVFFDEKICLTQWVGLAVLFAASMIMSSYNKNIKTKLRFPALLLLMFCGFSSGVADFSQKFFAKTSNAPVSVFNLYTYVFAALTLLVVMFVCKRGEEKSEGDVVKYTFPFILVMAIALFLNSYYKTLAAYYLPSAILYPLNQGLALVLSTVMSALFFGEKITPKAVAGIFTAFTGLLLINWL